MLHDSTISKNIARIREDDLVLTFSAVAELGLNRFKPDLLGDPDSLYNIAHERVCLVTFRRMVSQQGYLFMGVPPSLAKDNAFLKKAYRSFSYSYLAGLVRKEDKEKGRIAQDAANKGAYDRRERVSFLFTSLSKVLTTM